MNLSKIYKSSNKPIISFEVFPPKGDGEEYFLKVADLFSELSKLKKYNPSLVSVTYGAGGSNRDKTFDLVLKIKNELGINTMPHFTCVNFDREQTLSYIKQVESSGIKNILALRGDAPQGMNNFVPVKNGFAHANELVSFIKSRTDLSIAVAGYPEKHPEAQTMEIDLKNLKNKINSGADVVFTQLFFDNTKFFSYIEQLANMDINIPIIPGIMVIQSIKQINKIISLSGSKLPKEFERKIYDNQDDADYIKNIGIEFATRQVSELLERSITGVHFYPLNKAYAVSKVLDNIHFVD